MLAIYYNDYYIIHIYSVEKASTYSLITLFVHPLSFELVTSYPL